MTGYIDLHTHILPDVDDGSSSTRETVAMLEQAYNEGVRTIVATPHYGECNREYNSEVAEKRVDLLNKYLGEWEKNGNPKEVQPMPGLRVVLGNEILYNTEIVEDLKSGKARTIGDTKWVLVEFYPNTPYATMVAASRDLTQAGYKPIFAHIERYTVLQGDSDKVAALKAMGVNMQVNAESFMHYEQHAKMSGAKSRATRTFTMPIGKMSRSTSAYPIAHSIAAWDLLDKGLIDVIASDAHGSKHRTPVMETAYNAIRNAAGEEVADRLIRNAEEIFRG